MWRFTAAVAAALILAGCASTAGADRDAPSSTPGAFQPCSRRAGGGCGAGLRRSPAAAEGLEDLIDHERRPEQALDDRQQVLPEPIGLLPEVDQGPEDAQTVDRAAASRRAQSNESVHRWANRPRSCRPRRRRGPGTWSTTSCQQSFAGTAMGLPVGAAAPSSS
jgi:hypothetical protein